MEHAKILFVDDEPNITEALKRALHKEPYEIFIADSALAALNILATSDIDIVVSDERMPGMSGSVFLGKVRQTYPETVRIILSGQANLEDVMRAINEGEIYRFCMKPINAADLSITIRQALQQKRLLEQSRRLLREYQKITRLEIDTEGAILLNEDEDRDTDVESLLREIEMEMASAS
jgi:DNA-binding NtrC family response regulator